MFISPRTPRREDCCFYHSYTLAEGEVVGDWDLRLATDQYLGGVDFHDRSVLEIGPASGFLSYHMEAAGAQVTCLEPPMSHLWDTVPIEGYDIEKWRAEFVPHIEGVRNSFWYVHNEKKSNVRVIEADPCQIPEATGDFDVALLACVLLHCRRPFDILESVARRTRQTVIVTELWNPHLPELPLCMLLPHQDAQQVHTWWQFTPQFFISALGLLGFTQSRILFHQQKQPSENRMVPLFTVVCERPETAGGSSAPC